MRATLHDGSQRCDQAEADHSRALSPRARIVARCLFRSTFKAAFAKVRGMARSAAGLGIPPALCRATRPSRAVFLACPEFRGRAAALGRGATPLLLRT